VRVCTQTGRFTPRNEIDGISSIIIATTIRSHWHWRSLNSNAIGSCNLLLDILTGIVCPYLYVLM